MSALDLEWAVSRLARHDYRARNRALAEHVMRGCEQALLGDALTPTQREHALSVYRSAVELRHTIAQIDSDQEVQYAAEHLHHALNTAPVLRASVEVQS